jgi:23S rRNA pseudouridine1911/1915/1917 synthase
MPPTPRDAAAVFHASPEVAGRTVSAALRAWLPERSWSQVRQLVRSRRVTVNGNVCVDEGRRLGESDVVKLLAQSAKKPPDEQDVQLQYLDQHVVVVEKPAGVTSNRHAEEKEWPSRRRQLQPTLDELLPQVIARVEARGRKRRGAGRPVRAVHRLDRETSGLMVFARTVPAERGLVEQFRRHTTHRRYLAVAQGRVEAAAIRSRLVRDRGDGRRGSTKLSNVGKEAITHVRAVEYFTAGPEQYTLVECRLETGRTHQIRIHLAEQGHPLCGETVYQPLFAAPREDRSGAPRIALHAAELGFVHPVSGEEMRFTMPLPKDLQDFVQRLRRPHA